MIRLALSITAFAFVFMQPVAAQEYFPACAQKYSMQQLEKVGTSKFRKFGFSIYNATLWAPNGVYDSAQHYALSITYARDLDEDTLVDAITEDIAMQDVVDGQTQAVWRKKLFNLMTDVNENDTLIGMYVPGGDSPLIRNCQLLGFIEDPALTKSFFAIWLGPTADPEMRENLVAQR